MLPHRRLAILSGLRPIRQVPWVSGSVLVGSVAANEIVDGVIIVDRFAGIPPEALENVELRDPLGDEPVVDVRDLELPPARWLEPGQHLEDLAGIKVDARHPKLAGRLLWLFDDLDNAILAVEARHPEVPEVVRVLRLRQEQTRPLGLLEEVLDTRLDRELENVVAQDHHQPVVADEPL